MYRRHPPGRTPLSPLPVSETTVVCGAGYLHSFPERWATPQNTQRNAYTQLSYCAISDGSCSTSELSVCTLPRKQNSVQKRIFVTSGAQETDTAKCGSHGTEVHGVLIGAPRPELRESLRNLKCIIFRHVAFNTRRKYPSSGKGNVQKLLSSLPPREKEPIVARKPQWQYQASIQGNHSSGP
jgi:hypothetical protein